MHKHPKQTCRDFDVEFQDAGLDVSGKQKAYLMDAMTQIGMRIEMMELIPGWTSGEKA